MKKILFISLITVINSKDLMFKGIHKNASYDSVCKMLEGVAPQTYSKEENICSINKGKEISYVKEVDNKIKEVLLSTEVTNYLFDSSDLTGEEFKKDFTEMYSWIDFKGNGFYRKKSYSNGWKIQIDNDKRIKVKFY